MLSLCVVAAAADGEAWRCAALRLRDAAVDVTADLPDATVAAEAVLLTGHSPPDVARLEKLIEAGRHVMAAVESWPAADDCLRLAAAARDRGVVFTVANADLHLPSRQLIKQQLDFGKLGRVGLIRSHRWEAAGDPTHDAPPDALARDIETALWLADARPSSVFALARPRYFQLHLGFADRMALLDYSAGLPPGDGYRSLSVIGSKGAAYADDHDNGQLLFRGGRPQAVAAGEGLKARVSLLQDFAATIAERRDTSPALRLRATAQAVLAAAAKSPALRDAVVPEDMPA